ncbi:MAG: LAO/AO transport system kinase [Oceanicoccus sp.]|jgi:LAO/AO transport system kinase
MPAIDITKLLNGERRTLAKAITLVESKLDSHREESQSVLEAILPNTGKSIRIGITGIPGVGKSTFIETFGLHLISLGKKVAVLAVDPSSPIAGGSILGDKTRMEELSRTDNAFIRPSPSEGALGGVANKTRETMLLCEAAGYDVVLVETVGVGQSEYEVASMVDFFMVLMLPNAGDELQGIKKGIMELADALVVNKADGDSINMANQTKQSYESAFHLLSPHSFWSPKVMTCSARNNENIEKIWEMISSFRAEAFKNGFLSNNRSIQNKNWMRKLLFEMLELKLLQNREIKRQIPELEEKVLTAEMTPYRAAKHIIDLL